MPKCTYRETLKASSVNRFKAVRCLLFGLGGSMRRRAFLRLLGGMTLAWPIAALAQNQTFPIGPAANPAAKLRAQEKAAAEKRSKEKEKKEECRKRAVTEKIAPHERKSFMSSCEKK
jgi:hypothetical protein